MTAQPLIHARARMSVAFERGRGPWLYDREGNKYLDATSSLAVCGLGHSHPAVTAAVAAQAGRLVHAASLYTLPLQDELARRLCDISGLDKVFFATSGAEANEIAIRLARRHGHARGIDRPVVVLMERAFHGRSAGTRPASHSSGSEQPDAGFVRVPFNDIGALRQLAEGRDDIAAVLIEPVQGEAGIRIADNDYLKALRTICNDRQWLLMADETQCGNGRSGRFLAFSHGGVEADVITTAEGLGNGVPIGTCIAREETASLVRPGSLGSTFAGNPLACAAALAVLDTLEHENLVERAEQLGQWMLNAFREELDGAPGIRDIRGRGLMLGIELEEPCYELAVLAKVKGILISVTGGGKVVRLLPPLIISEIEANLIVGVISKLIRIFVGDDGHNPRG